MIAELKKDGSIELQVKRTLAFPRELVFSAWLKAEHLMKWMGPTQDINLGLIEIDPQPKGKYRFGFDDKNCLDTRSFVHGEFLKITAPSQLVFTWIWEAPLPEAGVLTLVTVDFHEVEGGTEMVLTHQKFMDKESCERHNAGWTGTLDKLQALLAGQTS
ncbi:MAG: SRPBCC domain-containing protein [Paraglaciecola sp.]|uniref:SRPBCC family protein n=1 Tax=Paraglaciecola sp. TaxID=1920173 RepID=UPI003262D6E9